MVKNVYLTNIVIIKKQGRVETQIYHQVLSGPQKSGDITNRCHPIYANPCLAATDNAWH